MSWTTEITNTLDALDARSNPTTEDDLKQVEALGQQLATLTAQITSLSPAERAESEPQIPGLMLRIQTVMDRLENTRTHTAEELTKLRQRQTAARAYGK